MDFTREPIIETVITPREGCTLVIRNSKGSGQEEYFVDALEVVIFGNAIFFRSRERPKAFLVPATDYEVLEVRETRLVLKNVGLDRSIKIAGGREASLRTTREPVVKNEVHEQPAEKQSSVSHEGASQVVAPPEVPSGIDESKLESRIDKKRDRRRNYRRRRGRDEDGKVDSDASAVNVPEGASVELPAPSLSQEEITASASSAPLVAVLSSLLAPPPNLISETIARYKDNALFKGAFFLKDEEEDSSEEAFDDVAEVQEASTTNPDGADDEQRVADQAFFEEDYRGADSLKSEDVEVELPQMSLDFPVYVPHEKSVCEERVGDNEECTQVNEECQSACNVESSHYSEFKFESPPVEEKNFEQTHAEEDKFAGSEEPHVEEMGADLFVEESSSGVFVEELSNENFPVMENSDSAVPAENSSNNEASAQSDDSGKFIDEHH